MIEFLGDLSDRCKAENNKRLDNSVFKIFLGVSSVIFIVAIVSFAFGMPEYKKFLIYFCFSLVLALIIKFVPRKGIVMYELIKRIVIENDEITATYGSIHGITKTASISKVKKVIDDGEWYRIIIRIQGNCWICEKSLLKKGTLDEFEKIFQGKIIKRSTKS